LLMCRILGSNLSAICTAARSFTLFTWILIGSVPPTGMSVCAGVNITATGPVLAGAVPGVPAGGCTGCGISACGTRAGRAGAGGRVVAGGVAPGAVGAPGAGVVPAGLAVAAGFAGAYDSRYEVSFPVAIARKSSSVISGERIMCGIMTISNSCCDLVILVLLN